MIFTGIVFVTSILAGICAAIAGFGIGSILTPLLSLSMGTKTAVAFVSVPHLAGTILRFWFVKSDVDRKVFKNFGLMSALGGLLGAILHTLFQSRLLALLLAALLIFVGMMGILKKLEKMRVDRHMAGFAGFISGGFGGLVGNQGGVRSAALLGFDLPKSAFIATATAIALIVDGARMPVYLLKESRPIFQHSILLTISVAGVLFGTIIGYRLFKLIPEKTFKFVISFVLLALGIFMLTRGF